MPIAGTGNALSDYFGRTDIPYSWCHLPIYGNETILVDSYKKKKKTRLAYRKTPHSFFQRILTEGIFILSLYRKHPVDVYIGIDPLNALWGIILRRIFHSVQTVIFYTADYADRRFDQALMNWLYHAVDRIACRYSDQVWTVSSRIYQKRVSQRVPPEKLFFVPNTPLSPRIYPNRKKSRTQLVVVGTSVRALWHDVWIEALKRLRKAYPSLTVVLIGPSDFPSDIQKKLSMWQQQKIVVSTGVLHGGDVKRILNESGIGIALYRDVEPWTRYGDSMKIREYLDAGLPVITTGVVSTADVVTSYDCGVVIKPTTDAFVAAVARILGKNYARYQKHAIEAARAYAFDRMVEKPLSLIGITM